MHSALRSPPWTDLWRQLVTTVLFAFLLALAVVVAGYPEFGEWPRLGYVVLAAYLLAAVVVWSDAVPWPGD
ncbi:MAG: hypothetical protein V5A30_04420 [Haloarculaceae archaeon]